MRPPFLEPTRFARLQISSNAWKQRNLRERKTHGSSARLSSSECANALRVLSASTCPSERKENLKESPGSGASYDPAYEAMVQAEYAATQRKPPAAMDRSPGSSPAQIVAGRTSKPAGETLREKQAAYRHPIDQYTASLAFNSHGLQDHLHVFSRIPKAALSSSQSSPTPEIVGLAIGESVVSETSFV